MKKRSFGTLTDILVSPKSRDDLPTNVDRTKETVLPPGSATPGGAGRDIGKFENNTPYHPNGKPLQPRTKGLPGEEYGNPSKNDYNQVTRRTMTSALISLIAFEEALEEDLLEEAKPRQKRQRGKKKTYSKNYYRRNKQKIKRKQRVRGKKPRTKMLNKRREKRNKGRNRKRRASVYSVVSQYLQRD